MGEFHEPSRESREYVEDREFAEVIWEHEVNRKGPLLMREEAVSRIAQHLSAFRTTVTVDVTRRLERRRRRREED